MPPIFNFSSSSSSSSSSSLLFCRFSKCLISFGADTNDSLPSLSTVVSVFENLILSLLSGADRGTIGGILFFGDSDVIIFVLVWGFSLDDSVSWCASCIILGGALSSFGNGVTGVSGFGNGVTGVSSILTVSSVLIILLVSALSFFVVVSFLLSCISALSSTITS